MVIEQIKKDILLVTSVWTGAVPFFYEGEESSKGMPAFNNVFYRLLNDDRVGTIHILVWQPDRTVNIPSKYTGKVKTYTIGGKSMTLFQKMRLIYQTVALGVRIVKDNLEIRQLVGFGSRGGITALISRRPSMPVFRRLCGTFL